MKHFETLQKQSLASMPILNISVPDKYYQLLNANEMPHVFLPLSMEWACRLIENVQFMYIMSEFTGISIPENVIFNEFLIAIFTNSNNFYLPNLSFHIHRIDVCSGEPKYGGFNEDLYYCVHINHKIV
jgi:hypothetical protein